VVTNSGDVALSNVVVSDDHHVSVSCPKSTLQPGETMTCTGSGTAVAGQYHNVGTATGQPPCGSAVSASDSSWYYGQSTTPPGSRSRSRPTASTRPAPQVPTWRWLGGDLDLQGHQYRQSTLSNVQVTDNRGVAVTCPKSTLWPGR